MTDITLEAIDAPLRNAKVGKEIWTFRADQGAWYTLELITQKSYRIWIRRLLNGKCSRLEPLYLILWAMSATYREEQKLVFLPSDEDRRISALVPSAFLRLLPARLAGLQEMVLDLLVEDGLVSRPQPLAVTTRNKGKEPPAPEPEKKSPRGRTK